MKAVIMAGGEGSRLRPLTSQRPKPLLPIVGRPVMEHILRLLRQHGLRQVWATVHYLADEIESTFEDGSSLGVRVRYSVEDAPLGTAGSVKRLEEHLDEPFLIISGDALTDIDLSAAIAFHQERGAVATLVLARRPNPLEFGVVVTEPDGRIQRFLEKPSWGEVFSDTVNTGIYVVDPSVMQLVQSDAPADFSKDVFPALLQQGKPLFGYVAEGYWCDIGNVQQYRDANADALEGRVKVSIPGEEIGGSVWIGEGTQVDPGARLEGPLVIGHDCAIAKDVQLGPLTCVGDHSVIEAGAVVERSVVFGNAYIGRGVRVSAAVLGHGVIAKAQTTIGEAAVVGDNCLLEEGTTILPQVKLWPNKVTDAGSTVTMSLVWGTKWPGSLFGAVGVTGLANIEITPEFAAKLGAAFGATLDRGAYVVVSRDTHPATRMIKNALMSGLASVGSNVLDLRTMPCPVARHAALVSAAAGGVHLSLSPQDPELLQIEFFDAQGKALDRAAERKVEQVFFREDFRRTHREAVGNFELMSRAVEYYTEDFLDFVDGEAIRRARPKIVVDYAHGPLSLLMPVVLGQLGCESIALNAFVDPRRDPVTWEQLRAQSAGLSDIVIAFRADLGVIIDGQGERMAVVDETGHPVSGDELLAIMAALALDSMGTAGRIVVPVTASSVIEQVCEERGAPCTRTKADPHSLMAETARHEDALLAGDPDGGVIFPQMHPVYDALVAFGKLLEMMVKLDVTISAVKASLPAIHKAQVTVGCPWERKGAVMRRLHEETGDLRAEHIDGVKLYLDSGWVLVLPDVSAPLFHVYAESGSDNGALELVERYARRIGELQEQAA